MLKRRNSAHHQQIVTVVSAKKKKRIGRVQRHLILGRTGEAGFVPARGVRFGRKSKLTKHQRDEALARIAQGETLAALGRR